jgi:hypothetical protein
MLSTAALASALDVNGFTCFILYKY